MSDPGDARDHGCAHGTRAVGLVHRLKTSVRLVRRMVTLSLEMETATHHAMVMGGWAGSSARTSATTRQRSASGSLASIWLISVGRTPDSARVYLNFGSTSVLVAAPADLSRLPAARLRGGTESR